MGSLTFPIKGPGFLKSFSTQPRPGGRQGLMSSSTAHSLFLLKAVRISSQTTGMWLNRGFLRKGSGAES